MDLLSEKQLTLKIVMVTYNQERYIAQAIESVLIQKTDFAYRLVIGDDCSTDSTYDICIKYAQKYPDKITLIRNSINRGMLANYKQILDAYPAEYIAFLEGDDYWTDVNKLQTQFEVLQTNPAIGLVHTDCDLLFESGKLQSGSHQRQAESIRNGIVFEQILQENYIRPATVMFRYDLYLKYVPILEYLHLGFKTLDYPMWLDISMHTQFFYLNYSTSVYRIHGVSISNSNLYEKKADFFKSIFDIKRYALVKFSCDNKLRKLLINKCHIDCLTIEMEYQRYSNVRAEVRNLIVLDFQSFIIRILASNRYLIDLYAYYLKYRKKL